MFAIAKAEQLPHRSLRAWRAHIGVTTYLGGLSISARLERVKTSRRGRGYMLYPMTKGDALTSHLGGIMRRC